MLCRNGKMEQKVPKYKFDIEKEGFECYNTKKVLYEVIGGYLWMDVLLG